MKNKLLVFHDFFSLVEKKLTKEFCIEQKSQLIKIDKNDINYQIVVENNFEEMEINISVYVNDFLKPYLLIYTNYSIDKNGVHFPNNMSEVEWNKYSENMSQIKKEDLTPILVIHKDQHFSSVVIQKKPGTYYFKLLSMEEIVEEGLTINEKTIIFENEELPYYENKLLELCSNVIDFDEKSKKELFKRLEWSFSEIEEEHYETIWDSIKSNKDFRILMLTEQFDCSDTAPREELYFIIENTIRIDDFIY